MFLFQLYERTCKLLVLKLPLNFFNRIFPFRCKFEKYILISSSAVTFLLSLSIIQSVQFCFMRFMLLSKRCAASNAKSNERETSSNVRARFFCKWLIIEENGSRDEGVSEWVREGKANDDEEEWNQRCKRKMKYSFRRFFLKASYLYRSKFGKMCFRKDSNSDGCFGSAAWSLDHLHFVSISFCLSSTDSSN